MFPLNNLARKELIKLIQTLLDTVFIYMYRLLVTISTHMESKIEGLVILHRHPSYRD